MPQVHVPHSITYSAPAATSGWQWLPFPLKHRHTIREAIQLIDERISSHGGCNTAFSRLPSGRTFTEIWADPAIWISYDPTLAPGRYGATYSKTHITISDFALRMGRWTTAATLIHELAHVAGAGSTDSSAEDVLLDCLLQDLHDPRIIGDTRDVRHYSRELMV